MRCHLQCDRKKNNKNPASSLRAQAENGKGVQLSTTRSWTGCAFLLMGDVCAANIVIPGTAEILVAI